MVTRFKRDGEQYDVLVQVADADRTDPRDITDIYVRGRNGEMIQLANVLDGERGRGAEEPEPLQKLRSATVTRGPGARIHRGPGGRLHAGHGQARAARSA